MRIERTNEIKKIPLLMCLLVEWIVIVLIEIYGIMPIYYPETVYRFTIDKLFPALLAVCVYAVLAPKDLGKASTWAYLLLVLALGVPSTVMYWVFQMEINYMLVVLMFTAILSMTLRTKLRFKTAAFVNVDAALQLLFFAYIGISVYLFLKRGGIDSRALDFSEVYDLRAEDTIRGIDGYLKNWCVKMLFPFFLLYTFEKKQYIRTALCVVLQILLYLSFGEKTTLFSPMLIVGVYFAFRVKKPWVLFIGFSTVVLLPLITYIYTGEYDLLAVLSRRFCHIPSMLGNRYYDFFSQGNPHLWYTETIFGRLLGLQSPYPKTFAYYIANSHAMANTGVVADAYANGGIIICIFHAFVLGVTLLMYDSVLKGKKHKGVVMGVLGYSCINLMDNALLTSLLTNGMLLTLLVAMILPDETQTELDQLEQPSVKRSWFTRTK